MKKVTALEELRPLYDEVAKCGKCGFCQPTCPVHMATGLESHVARGKNMLFRNLIEGETVLSTDLKEAFENCLLCRACTANCFPAVKTDQLVVALRESYGQRLGRPTVQRMMFRGLLPHPKRMSTLVGLLWTGRRLGLATALKKVGVLRMINPRLEKAMEIREEVPPAFLRDVLKKRRLSPEKARFKVGYWVSCGYNYMLPEVGEATVEVLVRNGADVTVLPNSCCGMPVYGYGDLEGARLLAADNLDKIGDLEAYDYIVSDCASCSGHLKDYAQLLSADEKYRERAKQLVDKVRGFSEFLAEVGPSVQPGPLAASVTYHDPCHMTARYQGVTAQPRGLICSIPGVEFKELPEADWCCGAAGTYNIMHNDISMKILERKMANVGLTKAQILASECPGCIIQLSLGARRSGLPVRVMSVSQLLLTAYAGEKV
jgi:glycolate oxidase iron-sulfur subunit